MKWKQSFSYANIKCKDVQNLTWALPFAVYILMRHFSYRQKINALDVQDRMPSIMLKQTGLLDFLYTCSFCI